MAKRSRSTSRVCLDEPRRILVLPDQLNERLGPLAEAKRIGHQIVMVESRPWLARRPYHRQRIATILVATRFFAEELFWRGIDVEKSEGEMPFGETVRTMSEKGPPMVVMEPAEREMRIELAPLVRDGVLEIIPHDGWLTTRDEFLRACPRAPYRMDAFYRRIRQTHDILMDGDGKPLGGRLSFDADNRRPWRGEPAPPTPPRFAVGRIKREVEALIMSKYRDHPGQLDLEAIPGGLDEVETLWAWARRECMEHFGPFEDAMSVRSSGLFHTRISAMVNLHRLLPRRVLDDVLAMEIPLSSKEGFVRQLIGWREFVRHIHVATDGFREFGESATPIAKATTGRVGDGGYARWSGKRWEDWAEAHPIKWACEPEGIDAGAAPNALDADAPLPPAYWGTPSGLACLDNVVRDVWTEGWSHHITRLMVLGNIATLLGVSPRELTDWFWIAYIDSWDWVVEPNVLGMATFAAGEVMTTKPYISGAAYIDRMGDHCAGCAFDPKKNCPLTRLYWAFLARHAERFDAHPRMRARMGVVLRALEKRSADDRGTDERTFVRVRDLLINGQRVDGEVGLFSR